MKKILFFGLLLGMVLSGCSTQTTKLDEIIGEAEDDAAAFALILDYLNENVTDMTYEGTTKDKDGVVTNHGAGEMWSIDGKVYQHVYDVSSTFYQEYLFGEEQVCLIGMDAMDALYIEVSEEGKVHIDQLFDTDFDDLKVSSEKNEVGRNYILDYSVTGQSGKSYHRAIYTVNHQARITQTVIYYADENGVINDDAPYNETVFTSYNAQTVYDEAALLEMIKNKEGMSYADLTAGLE